MNCDIIRPSRTLFLLHKKYRIVNTNYTSELNMYTVRVKSMTRGADGTVQNKTRDHTFVRSNALPRSANG